MVPGDTLWDLANRYGTTVAALQRMNGAKARKLKPGVSLMVKAAKRCPAPRPSTVEPAAEPQSTAQRQSSTDDEAAQNGAEPVAEQGVQSAVVAEPAAEPVAEPVVQAAAEPVQAVEPAPLPVAEPAPEPASDCEGADDCNDEGQPAVNLPAEVASQSVEGRYVTEELAVYDDDVEVASDAGPVCAGPENPSAGGAVVAAADEPATNGEPGDDDNDEDDEEAAGGDVGSSDEDPYSGDGVPEDLVELPHFAEFGFTDDGSCCESYLGAFTEMPKNPRGTVNIYHRVRRGDNLWKIAKRYHTTVRNIENLNHLRRNPKKTRRLMHPGKLVLVRLGDPRDLVAARPFLADWVNLQPQSGYNIKRTSAAYGRPFAMNLMLRSMCEFRRRNPDAGNIVVGDWSGKVGGQLGRHLSHRTGRDVDLSYFIKGQPSQRGFSKATPDNIDVERSWELVRALLDTGEIEFIFMDWNLQKVLYEHALTKGFPEAELNQIFQYPDSRRVRSGIIRWARGHDNHIHVRFRCPKDDARCR